MTNSATASAVGDWFIDMDGRLLACNLSGEGAPTVILETGLGAESQEWAPVQREIERFARVFRYDRAGRGASDPAPGPRTAMDMVEDLRALLARAGVTPPYVLVGHSFGGLMMRLFAYHHRDEVAGLVQVDSMHEDQFDTFAPRFPPPAPADPAPFAAMRAFWTGGWRDPASTVERIDLVASQAEGHEVTSLKDLPMRVLVGAAHLQDPTVPAPVRPQLYALWSGLQDRLANLSTRAVVTRLEHCGHFIQRDDPAAVSAAILSLLGELRR